MRDRDAERAMLSEVYRRNLIAKYRALNAKHYEREATPEVGIFWMDRSGEVFHKVSISLGEAVPYGDFNTYDESHHEKWITAVRLNPKWEGMEYEEVPRGRVVHFMVPRADKFIVYLPEILLSHESRISKEFKLPPGYTEFDYSDEHYGL